MKKAKHIATPEEILEQLEALNFKVIFKDLVDYAMYKMKGESIVDAEKLVGDVFEKTISGVRKWNKAVTFKQFLFGAVKSLVSQYNNQYGKKVMDFDYEFEIEQIAESPSDNSEQFEILVKKVTEKLRNHIPPPDEIEEMVFECWIDEIKKRKEIAELWDLDVKDVYKAVKRLQRKLNPIRDLLNSSSNE